MRFGTTLRAMFLLGAISAVFVLPAAAHAATATTSTDVTVTSNSATVRGTVNTQAPATFHFEYATDEDFVATGGYTHATPKKIVGAQLFGHVPVPLFGIDIGVAEELVGLSANKRYHVRVVATENVCAGSDAQETCPPLRVTNGQDVTFRTLKKDH